MFSFERSLEKEKKNPVIEPKVHFLYKGAKNLTVARNLQKIAPCK